MADTNAERQAATKQRKRQEGYSQIPIWVHVTQRNQLMQQFPGPRGGIDWSAVIDTAIQAGDKRDKRDKP